MLKVPNTTILDQVKMGADSVTVNQTESARFSFDILLSQLQALLMEFRRSKSEECTLVSSRAYQLSECSAALREFVAYSEVEKVSSNEFFTHYANEIPEVSELLELAEIAFSEGKKEFLNWQRWLNRIIWKAVRNLFAVRQNQSEASLSCHVHDDKKQTLWPLLLAFKNP